MSDPYSAPGDGDAPSPFDRPTLEPERKSGPGVGKPLLIGCGALLVLALVAGGLFVAYQNEIAAWLFETMEEQLQPLVPEDLPADVGERYERAFADAVAAIRAGEYDPFAMQDAQQEFTRVARDVAAEGEDARMSREDVERLTEVLEAIPAAEGGEGRSGLEGEPPEATRRPAA